MAPGQSTRHARAPPRLFPCRDRGTPGRDGQHDAEADRDDRADTEPDARNLTQDPRLPEREAGAEEEDEVTDEVQFQDLMGERAAGKMPGAEGFR